MPIATGVLVRCSGAISGSVRGATCGVPHVATLALFSCPPIELRSTGQPCLANDRKNELTVDYTLKVLPGSITVCLPLPCLVQNLGAGTPLDGRTK